MKPRCSSILGSFAFVAVVVMGCSSSSNNPPPATTGSSCKAANDCYPGIDAGALKGTPTCLTSVSNGYCTHTCQADTDCCSVPGECATGVKELCGSFESSGAQYCFVSCAASDLPAGTTDANAFCQRTAGASASCRSSGGGANNKKFCG